MFVLLPLFGLILLFCCFRQLGQDWRVACLWSAISWGVFVTFTTELLSLIQGLTFLGLFLSWLIFDGILLLLYLKKRQPNPSPPPAKPPLPFSSFQLFLLASIGSITLLIALIALIASPNNWDSMTYHLGRVVHWMQNQSVAHYPTAIPRQLSLGPWSGFAVTHLQILSGGDRFANSIQWFSLVGNLIGVSLIAKVLGGSLKSQILAAVFCVTIPMGILQASSTQTDLVGGLWMVCLIYHFLIVIEYQKNPLPLFPIGASAGLAVLAKGTAYFYIFPFSLWFAIIMIRRLKWQVWQPFSIMAGLALLLNLGHYSRNFLAFGSILGGSDTYDMEALTLTIFISNILRHLALQISTPVRSINLIIINSITFIHRFLGVDPNDPGITFPPGQAFDLHSKINHEDLASDPLHLLLVFLSLILFTLTYKKFSRHQKYLLTFYSFAIVCAFLLFCAFIIWSPWRSRLHLPLFIFFAPFIGIILDQTLKPKITNTITTFILISSLLWVFFNESRPLIANTKFIEEKRVQNIFNTSPIEQYFMNLPDLQKPYQEAVEFFKAQNCSQIGLTVGGDTWEYPLWVLMKKAQFSNFRIEHIEVENAVVPSGIVIKQDFWKEFQPCAIFAANKNMALDLLKVQGQDYQKTLDLSSVVIFTPVESSPDPS